MDVACDSLELSDGPCMFIHRVRDALSREKPETILFLLGYAILLVYVVLFNSMLRERIPFQGKWSFVACGFFALSEFLVLHREGFRGYFFKRTTVIGISAAAVSAAVTFACGSSAPFVICFCVFCARRVPFEKIARTALWAIPLTCLIVVTCAFLGEIDDVVWVQGVRVRHGLGMRYTTTVSHYVFFCALLYIFIKRCRLNAVDTALIVSIDIAVYLLTNSRNSFTLTLVAVLLAWLVRITGFCKTCKPLRYAATSIVPLFAIISIALMIAYSPNIGWQASLNNFLGGRIEISHRSYQLYGIPLFGQDQEFVGQGIEDDGQKRDGAVTVIDNSYCNMLITKGALFTVLVLGSMTLLVWQSEDRNSKTITCIVLLVAFHSLTDPQLLTIQFDVPLLLVGCCLLGDAECRDETFATGMPSHEIKKENLCTAIIAAIVFSAVIIPAVLVHDYDSHRPLQGINASFYVEPRKPSSNGEAYRLDTKASVISYNNLDEFYPEARYRSGELHAIWIAKLSPLTSGEYEFAVDGDGAIRVTVDNAVLIDVRGKGNQGLTQSSKTVVMRAGSYHDLCVEWNNADGGNSLTLLWRTVGNDEWHVVPFNCFSIPDD